jgi:GNAT superfamily N-acetyltransferase
MIRYRLAQAADAALIHAMLLEMAAGETFGGSVESLLAHGFGKRPRFRVVLAEDRVAQALGFCLFLPEYSSWRGAMGVFVQDLYLRPSARGLGAGRGLLAAAWAQAQDWQPQFIALMVKRSNLPALGFYRSLGFDLREAADPLILSGTALQAVLGAAG